ncbi:MAG: hypothetical protein K2G21_03805 [Muribaculaceae bacterium]|nr:hypothetical protein [Muribaculaceae bacterium]
MKKLLRTAVASLLLLCGVQALCSRERIILLNEGNWQADNGRVSYFEDGKVISNQWFRDVNGFKLGDTPNDIIRVNDNLIAIAVNWSNIVQFITPQGKAVTATEDIPNNRKLASDGNYVYISSYGHECKVNDDYEYFDKGYVAKIDLSTFKVVAAVEVGYEPEGIAYYDGYLFVANTGGYAFQEDHEYETTVSVIDAETMEVIRDVDTGQINLYGKLSQSGKYLCINSPGDYYDVMAATVIFDCEKAIEGNPDDECFVLLDYAATYSCTAMDGQFYAVGSRYSYYTGQYEFNYVVIDPELVMESQGAEGVDEDGFPGTVLEDLKKISMPYGIYVNPYTGYIYATDAGSFAAAGSVIQWSPEGEKLGEHEVYINPAHFLAVNDDMAAGIDNVVSDIREKDDVIYNLQGIRVDNPRNGQLYISNGRKFIFRE